VLEKAMLAFWRHGFEATGLVELEEATGLRRQSLYGAFGDKRALFERVVDFYFERVLTAGVIDVLDAEGSAVGNLERIFATWEAVASMPDFNGCLIGNAASDMRSDDDAMRDVLRRKLRLVENAFARTLERAIADGELRSDLDARDTAKTLVVISQGLAVVARVQKSPGFVRGVVDTARRLLR